MRKRRIAALFALLLAMMLVLAGCGTGKEPSGAASPEAAVPALTEVPAEEPAQAEVPAEPEKITAKEPEQKAGPITDPQEIADYLFAYGKLPENFITKAEAQALGWDSSRNYVSDVAPGKSIGGDRYGNYEGKLPKVKGRKYFECDCNYRKGKRNAERIVYSNDGQVWYTGDHYQTFTEMFPSR